jgi:hypothetical protein
MILIGLSGHAGTGKDTAATYLNRTQGLKIYHFADALKEACVAAFGMGLNAFTEQQYKNVPDPYWNYTPRQLAQLVGTELFRTRFGDNFWIRRLELEFRKAPPTGAIIADVRFQNEANWIWEQGGYIINLTRLGCTGNVGIENHASEQGFSVPNEFSRRFYALANNDTVEELYANLHHLYRNQISK